VCVERGAKDIKEGGGQSAVHQRAASAACCQGFQALPALLRCLGLRRCRGCAPIALTDRGGHVRVEPVGEHPLWWKEGGGEVVAGAMRAGSGGTPNTALLQPQSLQQLNKQQLHALDRAAALHAGCLQQEHMHAETPKLRLRCWRLPPRPPSRHPEPRLPRSGWFFLLQRLQ